MTDQQRLNKLLAEHNNIMKSIDNTLKEMLNLQKGELDKRTGSNGNDTSR